MTTLAYAAVALNVLSFLGLPLVWGQSRKPYGPQAFYGLLIDNVIVLALAGRVLGWW